MERVNSLIDILHEIVIDFVTAFLSLLGSLRHWIRKIKWSHLPKIPSLLKRVPSIKINVQRKVRLSNITSFLSDTFSELDEVAERSNFLIFFAISVIIIFILGNLLFYLALIS